MKVKSCDFRCVLRWLFVSHLYEISFRLANRLDVRSWAAPSLLFQFYEADELHRQQEARLRARLEQLEKDAEQHQAVVDGLASKYMDTIEKLQSDKARLEVCSTAMLKVRKHRLIYSRVIPVGFLSVVD